MNTCMAIINKQKNHPFPLAAFLCEDEKIATFSTSNSYCEYHCIIKEGCDDISAAFKDTLHRILDNGGNKEDVRYVLGAFIPSESELAELEEFGECIHVDLGYVIPGLIMSLR